MVNAKYETVKHIPLHLSRLSNMANRMAAREVQWEKITDKQTQKLNLDLKYTFKRSEAEWSMASIFNRLFCLSSTFSYLSK